MSAEHDRKFFDTFMLILGILAAITIGLMVLAGMISDRTSKQFHEQDPLKQQETLARIAPVAKVAVAGQDNSALAPPAPAAAAAAVDLPGEEVYAQVCGACHTAGIAGAPKTGDKAAWAPRIAQGADTLHKHAIEGFQGKAGYMPPKGGRTDLSDQSVINAVDYLVNKAN
ncbi:MAG: c-type cytochrome [Gammaproteobacteria bacterium]|nr:c-type cytochrome [Gammaproteobacteria bacterium]MDH5175210.1 c-type cytochrome [Gammaproteobacteria bacterium]